MRRCQSKIAILLSRKQPLNIHDIMPLANSFGGLFKKGVSDYPVLLCGLSCAGKSTLLNKWKTGDGSVPVTSNIAIASIEVPGGAKITFRDIGLDDVEDRTKTPLWQSFPPLTNLQPTQDSIACSISVLATQVCSSYMTPTTRALRTPF